LMPGDPEDLLPGTRVDRYLVLKMIGRGGMGVVYMAYDEELDRRIALKLLAPHARGDEASSGAQRLLREAQALARLSHPNVVSVFDAGSFEGLVFLAMEYLDGVTLREWRAAQPRSVREILAVYAQAGRGLEAAHAAGILHRDFKPDNTVIDAGGRVRVLDFGLARLGPSLASFPELEMELADTEIMRTPSIPLRGPLTQFGDLLGTPAYMAPEQFRGGPIDAKTDQFSFCVALHEALYGLRPYDGGTLAELRTKLEAGDVPEPPAGIKVPGSVRAALLRGLRPKPDERFASMGALLAALEATTGRRRTNVVIAASAAVVVAGLAVVSAGRSSRPPMCAGTESEMNGVWDDAQRAAVASAFDRSGNPRAKDAWNRVRPVLDDYAARWVAMRTESCVATRVRGTQSDEALDLRTACLDQRRAELSATVAALSTAAEKLVDDAVKTARALSPLDACADVPALRAPFAQPHDPAARARAAAIRDRIGRATALVHTHKFEEAANLASEAAHDAHDLGNRALEGAALLQQADAEGFIGRMEAAHRLAHDAALASNVARDDSTEASAWSELVLTIALGDGRVEDADEYAALADAAITRAGGSYALRSELAQRRGDVLYARGKIRESVPVYEEAVSFAARAWGPDSARTAERDVDVATSVGDLGKTREAIARLEGDVAKEAAEYGDASPLLASTLYD
ncbi:MAG TPA: protein kinase, partial [Polyangiaceae bacterium]